MEQWLRILVILILLTPIALLQAEGDEDGGDFTEAPTTQGSQHNPPGKQSEETDPISKQLARNGLPPEPDKLAKQLTREFGSEVGVDLGVLEKTLSKGKMPYAANNTLDEKVEHVIANLHRLLPIDQANKIQKQGGSVVERLNATLNKLREQRYTSPTVTAYNPPAVGEPNFKALGFAVDEENIPIVPLGPHATLPRDTLVMVSGHGKQLFRYRDNGVMPAVVQSPHIAQQQQSPGADTTPTGDQKTLGILNKALASPSSGGSTPLSPEEFEYLKKVSKLTSIPDAAYSAMEDIGTKRRFLTIFSRTNAYAPSVSFSIGVDGQMIIRRAR